jgi:hypothetical protein
MSLVNHQGDEDMSGRSKSRPTALLAVGASCALLVGLLASPSAASETASAASLHATQGLGALPSDDYVSPTAGLGAYRSLVAAETGRASAAPLPAAVDLSAFAPPVGDQGQVNSCVMWAIDYAMMGWYANRQSHLGAPYAPMYAYSQIQDKYGWWDDGAYSHDAYDIAQEQGSRHRRPTRRATTTGRRCLRLRSGRSPRLTRRVAFNTCTAPGPALRG